MIHYGGRRLLLHDARRMFQSGKSGHSSPNDPALGVVAAPSCSAPDAPVRGVCHISRMIQSTGQRFLMQVEPWMILSGGSHGGPHNTARSTPRHQAPWHIAPRPSSTRHDTQARGGLGAAAGSRGATGAEHKQAEGGAQHQAATNGQQVHSNEKIEREQGKTRGGATTPPTQ